ncbi:MAG TPA: GDSL-type esterase/lipase family protein [bacterium]|mgnify:FL=1|nr:GDSL-type esterase/lipase family protein [bacterium]HPG82985.1 GDSL-type esterase/lipase family protein [bacterium]HPM58450.1 GDSL-type esterase/lipase family protein [bacterium]
MKPWMLVVIAGFACALFAQEPGWPPRSSGEFFYRYEARSGDPIAENPGEWSSSTTPPGVPFLESGTLGMEVGMNRYWSLHPDLLGVLDHARGWTMEVRLRVIAQSGRSGAIAMAVDDEPGQPGVLSGLQIHSDSTQFCFNGAVVDTRSNSDGFHTFRLAEEANSRTVHAWRDGRYLGSASYPYYMISLSHFLLVGSWSGRIAGTAEIDYVRWEPSGAYAPAAALLVISESDGSTQVSEKGPGSDSFAVVLGRAPAADVTVTIAPGFGSSRAEEADLGAGSGGAITLTFTPANWNIPQNVTVTAVDDTLREWFHTSVIGCRTASSDPDFDGLEELVTLFVMDNDEVIRLVESGEGTEVREEGSTTDFYRFRFGQLPDQPVQVALHFDPRRLRVNGGTVSPQVITLSPAEAQNPLPIEVAAYDNTDRDLLLHARIRHLLTSADPLFNGAAVPDLAVRIHENDTQHLQPDSFTIPLVNLDETDRQVVIDRQPGQYLGHPTTVLLEDSTTMLTVYPKGHGSGEIVYKRSFDGGVTWSRALPTPASWATSREVPTLFRMTDPGGVERLILFSGLYPARRAWSADNGQSWSELEMAGDWGGIVVMGGAIRLKDGRYMALFHDDGRFFKGANKTNGLFIVFKTLSSDGGLTWSHPEPIIECDWADPCEPGLIRSPDGQQILVLLRENRRKFNSFYITSDDEGESWSPMVELPDALTGDRHTGQYTRDGRLFVSFRDMAKGSPTWGDWVGWLGTWEDILRGREGEYRILLKDNTYSADTAYPGVERLPSGMMVVTTYGHWATGEQPYIVSTRFMPEELGRSHPPAPVGPLKIVVAGDGAAGRGMEQGQPLKLYADHLAADLPAAGVAAEVLNRGAAGLTSDAALQGFQQQVLDEKPDLVILHFGSEDAAVEVGATPARLLPRVPLERFTANLTAMVQQLKARGIRPLLMTSHPLCWGDSSLARFGKPMPGSPYLVDDPFGLNTVLSRYTAAVREVAIREEVQLVDIYGRFISHANVKGQELTDLVPDGLHANAAGQRRMAAAIYEVLGIDVPEEPSGVEGGMESGSSGEEEAQPHKFGIGGYPNPFNPATELVVELPEPGPIRVEVFDRQGRRVKLLAEGFFGKGVHRMAWDARDAEELPVAAGVYWARLSAGAHRDAHKMVVLR